MNDDKDVDENKIDDDDKERQDAKGGAAADRDVLDLIDRIDDPQGCDCDSDSDYDSDGDDEKKQRNREDSKDTPVIDSMK